MDLTNNLNFDEYQAIGLVLQKLSAHPTSNIDARIYYNTTDNTIYYRAGSQWVPIMKSITAGNGLTNSGTSANPIFDVNADGLTIEVVGDVVRIKDSGVSTAKVADLAITTAKVADSAITFSKIQNIPTMTVIGRVVGGTGASSAITILNDLSSANSSTLITSGAVKAYVDASIAGLGKLIGGFNASSATDLPGNSTTNKGDYWYVTGSGTVQGQVFNVGDMIIANQANPTVTNASHYIFLESNRDAATTTVLGVVRLATNQEILDGTGTGVITPQTLILRTATETRTGLAQKATDAEALAGVENTKFVTAQQVKAMSDANNNYSALVGNGVATSITITHNLGTTNIVPALYRVSTNSLVIADISTPTTSTVVVTFGRPPASNEFKLVLDK
jgi:hypothetical protein